MNELWSVQKMVAENADYQADNQPANFGYRCAHDATSCWSRIAQAIKTASMLSRTAPSR